MGHKYIRFATLDTDIVVKAMLAGKQSLQHDGITISLQSSRIKTFTKGTCCVHCGLQASYFAIEKQGKGRWHLNLYHRTTAGKQIMLTSDHILAKANGGGGEVENRQPMCAPCNALKSDFPSIEAAIAAKQARYVQGSSVESYYNTLIRRYDTVNYTLLKMSEADTSKDWFAVYKRAKKKFENVQKCLLQAKTLTAELFDRVNNFTLIDIEV